MNPRDRPLSVRRRTNRANQLPPGSTSARNSKALGESVRSSPSPSGRASTLGRVMLEVQDRSIETGHKRAGLEPFGTLWDR